MPTAILVSTVMQQGNKTIEDSRIIGGSAADHEKPTSLHDEIMYWLYQRNPAAEKVGGMNLRIFRQKWYPQGEVILKHLEQEGLIVVQRFATGAFNYKFTDKGAQHARSLGDESPPEGTPD